jgi:hypothetical protein
MTEEERAPGFYWTREKDREPAVLQWTNGTWQTGTLDADIEVLGPRLLEPGQRLAELVRQLVREVRQSGFTYECKGEGLSIRITTPPPKKRPKPPKPPGKAT